MIGPNNHDQSLINIKFLVDIKVLDIIVLWKHAITECLISARYENCVSSDFPLHEDRYTYIPKQCNIYRMYNTLKISKYSKRLHILWIEKYM